MIRRGFWLTAGAVTGIYGYRRVSAAGRRLSASLNPASAVNPAAGSSPLTAPAATAATVAGLARGAGMGRRGMIRLVRETYRFSRDVREGMQLYLDEHPAPGSTSLATDRSILAAGRSRRDGRATNLELKDGH